MKTHKPRTRPNGSGTAIKRGKTWTARVVVGWKIKDDGHSTPVWRTKGGFSRKRDALDYCSTLLKSPEKGQKRTFESVYEEWLPTHAPRVSESTVVCYRAAYKHFKPLHGLWLSNITTADLQLCVDKCTAGKRTKENMKTLAVLMWNYALPRHLTDMNYASFIDTGTQKKGTHPAFTKEHVEIIRKNINTVPFADIIYVMIYTGFRPTELLSLKHEDYIDGILYGGIKTAAGKDRAVPVSDKIKPIIDSRMKNGSDYLFPNDKGEMMPMWYFRRCFCKALADMGIQSDYVPYSCRHTFANLLRDVQGSDKDKAGLMGHTDYKTTKRHYQTSELSNLREIINNL